MFFLYIFKSEQKKVIDVHIIYVFLLDFVKLFFFKDKFGI